jgi:RHS repeat-associated protein
MPSAAPSIPRHPPRARRRMSRRVSGGSEHADPRSHTAVSGRRYYSPSQGRFLGRDPIEEEGGLNLYAFCGNEPIAHWDVLGKYAVLKQDGASLTITVPLHFPPGTDENVIKDAVNAIQNAWKGTYGGVTVTTHVELMNTAPDAKNRGNSVEMQPPNAARSSTYGTDRNGNGILVMRVGATDTDFAQSRFAHEAGHAIGLKDQYERKWFNNLTGEEDWFPAGVTPGDDWQPRIEPGSTKANAGWQSTIMGTATSSPMTEKDFWEFIDTMASNDQLWISTSKGLIRAADLKASAPSKDAAMVLEATRRYEELRLQLKKDTLGPPPLPEHDL